MNPTRTWLFTTIFLASILSIGSITAREVAMIDMAAFGAKAAGRDTTPSVRAALDEARRSKASKLTFPPGRYDFWPENASEHYLFISNNDEGLKRVIFPLTNLEGLEIDGGGASFIFHGPMVPFLIEESRGVTLKNLSFDFSRPFHSEGRVLAVTDEHVDLEFSRSFPMKSATACSSSPTGKRAQAPQLPSPMVKCSSPTAACSHSIPTSGKPPSWQRTITSWATGWRLRKSPQSGAAHDSQCFGQARERFCLRRGNAG